MSEYSQHSVSVAAQERCHRIVLGSRYGVTKEWHSRGLTSAQGRLREARVDSDGGRFLVLGNSSIHRTLQRRILLKLHVDQVREHVVFQKDTSDTPHLGGHNATTTLHHLLHEGVNLRVRHAHAHSCTSSHEQVMIRKTLRIA